MNEGWIENRATPAWPPRIEFHELWTHRRVAFFLALRDLKVRYAQTLLGIVWVVLQPLAGAAVFAVVFGHFVRVHSDGIPYPVFVFAGLTLWTYFSGALGSAAESLVGNSALVTKVYFPRILAPLGAVLPGLVDIVFASIVLAVLMASYSVVPGLALLLAPVWVLSTAAFAFAAGLWLAALNVEYRDVRHALGFVVQVWLFATPVVFPSSIVHGGWRYALALNPMTGLVDGFRWSVLAAPAPSRLALISLASGLLILLGGLAYFRAAEQRFADVI